MGVVKLMGQNLGFNTYNEKVHSIHKGLKKEAFLELLKQNSTIGEHNSTPKHVL